MSTNAYLSLIRAEYRRQRAKLNPVEAYANAVKTAKLTARFWAWRLSRAA